MDRENIGMTIKEEAAGVGKAELTIRHMVKVGKLPEQLVDRPPWGPTYVIEDADLVAVRKGITGDFQQALDQLEAHRHAQLQE